MAASSRSPSFAYTAATALPEPQSLTQYGWVPASRSYRTRSGGCFPKTGISKSLPPSPPMLPHPLNASASSRSGPRGAGSGCISSHQPYASGVETLKGGSTRATSAGAAGGAGTRNCRSPRPHASAAGAPLAKNATSAPSRVAKWSSSWRGTTLPASAFTACSAAAASLDPPPRPDRTGMRFVSSSATPNLCPVASRTARAARTARFCSGGPSSGPCTVSAMPPPRPPTGDPGPPPVRRLEHAGDPRERRQRDPEPDDPLQYQRALRRHRQPERPEAHGERCRVHEPQEERPRRHAQEASRALQDVEPSDESFGKVGDAIGEARRKHRVSDPAEQRDPWGGTVDHEPGDDQDSRANPGARRRQPREPHAADHRVARERGDEERHREQSDKHQPVEHPFYRDRGEGRREPHRHPLPHGIRASELAGPHREQVVGHESDRRGMP